MAGGARDVISDCWNAAGFGVEGGWALAQVVNNDSDGQWENCIGMVWRQCTYSYTRKALYIGIGDIEIQ